MTLDYLNQIYTCPPYILIHTRNNLYSLAIDKHPFDSLSFRTNLSLKLSVLHSLKITIPHLDVHWVWILWKCFPWHWWTVSASGRSVQLWRTLWSSRIPTKIGLRWRTPRRILPLASPPRLELGCLILRDLWRGLSLRIATRWGITVSP